MTDEQLSITERITKLSKVRGKLIVARAKLRQYAGAVVEVQTLEDEEERVIERLRTLGVDTSLLRLNDE